ncbi:class I SAM-dependent methyltransferase [Spirillospora sp. CA-294931]|uniref:class I SAM-dependent methyltransferase n=1 Tax=Spirillospora sp. CA-294931 TaxID=3240042 RepID=UPI003D94C99B
MYSDADAAALYDVLYPWNPETRAANRFYFDLVMAADSVLDVGCGTGAMLHRARDQGHQGRLVGLDPDRPSLDRARRRTGVEWIEGTAADAPSGADFALATMTGHAFQCLVTDHEVRSSLAAIHGALRPGGRFAFETRHPQARAWEKWNPANISDTVDASGRALRIWHQVESVVHDVVTFTETTAEPNGPVLRVDRAHLRFLAPDSLDAFLHEAGFEIETRLGAWDNTPVTPTSTEIITIATRN